MQTNWIGGLVSAAFRALGTGLGLVLVLVAVATTAHAGGPLPPGPPAPEIDPGSVGSALTLLAGGVLMLTGCRKK